MVLLGWGVSACRLVWCTAGSGFSSGSWPCGDRLNDGRRRRVRFEFFFSQSWNSRGQEANEEMVSGRKEMVRLLKDDRTCEEKMHMDKRTGESFKA